MYRPCSRHHSVLERLVADLRLPPLTEPVLLAKNIIQVSIYLVVDSDPKSLKNARRWMRFTRELLRLARFYNVGQLDRRNDRPFHSAHDNLFGN